MTDSAAAVDDAALTTAQRARCERNRQRARALRENRTARPALSCGGGGFLPAEQPPPARPTAPAAPVVHPADQPRCLDCGRSFPQSFLFDSFEYSVCDDCRDDEGAHALLARTEAKALYLLQDCDLDSRPPPLRCLLRRNPHAPRGTMRLYLRAQLEDRAHLVWGGAAALAAERDRRDAARERAARTKAARRLRALRMDVRGSLYAADITTHTHEFGDERPVDTGDDDDDQYERTCLHCGHVERYEKM